MDSDRELQLIAAQGYCMVKTVDYDESHDWRHYQRVVDLVEMIAQNESACAEDYVWLLMIAAWIHDIVDHKYVKDLNMAMMEMRLYLLRIGLRGVDVNRIMQWITHTSWSKEKRGDPAVVEVLKKDFCARILADADRLDSISHEESPIPDMPMGIYRCYQYSKMANPNATEEELIALVKKHCDEKLLILHEWIFTKSGKELAKAGTDAIQKWYNAHQREIIDFLIPSNVSF